MRNLIPNTIFYASLLHEGQKYGEFPYIVHCALVARHFREKNEIIVALLHDAVENTSATVDEIWDIYGGEIAAAIDAITRRDTETYKQYIARLAQNPLALKVKCADLKENLHSLDHWHTEYSHLRDRYVNALAYLREHQFSEIEAGEPEMAYVNQ
jgi:(p)ppGpp synthase/HD superfamily hydrolase